MSSRKSGDRGTSPHRRLAALGGLILAFLIAALEPPPAFAQDFFQQLFGGGGGGGYSDSGGYPSYHRRHATSRRHSYVPRERQAEPQSRWRPRAPRSGGEPERSVYTETASGGRSYCVRECDGYFFPVGLYSSASDTASHQRACGRLCPGARTTLYVMRGGTDKMEDAVAARGGATYARLMAALQRKNEGKAEGEKDKECSCHAGQTNESSIEAIYLDPTLRRGDAVMTTHGVEIFHGASRYPYSKSDFRPLARSPDLDEPIRRRLAALERASKQGRPSLERRAARPVSERRSQSGGREPRD
jgi:hypothetical protein